MKSKEKIDEMHQAIRPYILRRLKEDVEKSVPPKEETLIEVELTVQQKQYYRALYEKNVGFLQRNKKRALDGPSLSNLAMQLRKCCNHLFLLNGVEEEIRKQKDNQNLSEADLLARGSGKLVLLDKLLPRLKENGHRILIFSQFKIMLDVLEDYLHAKQLKFERIDGSITGHRRQAAIDRFQDPGLKDPPFVMLLSTRAGGVGINLTSAGTSSRDTPCILHPAFGLASGGFSSHSCFPSRYQILVSFLTVTGILKTTYKHRLVAIELAKQKMSRFIVSYRESLMKCKCFT
jgi:chromodomain-helicase-DNA-binding protein 7